MYPVSLQTECGQPAEPHEDFARPDVSQPDADYDWAKLTGERLARHAIEQGVPVMVMRLLSGYGEDQSEDYAWRAFIKRASWRKDPFAIRGNPHQVRDWGHVDGVVRGAPAVVEADQEGENAGPVNLCMGGGTSMLDVAKGICSRAGYAPKLRVDEDALMGVFRRVGNPTKVVNFYAPGVSLEEGGLLDASRRHNGCHPHHSTAGREGWAA